MKAMSEVGDGRIIDLIWAGSEETELIDKFLKDGVLEIKKQQGIQLDGVKTDRSTFKELYKEIKEGTDGDKYWENGEARRDLKEQWAKSRCGNIGKTGKKGFKSWKCAICNTEHKTLERIWTCKTAWEGVNQK